MGAHVSPKTRLSMSLNERIKHFLSAWFSKINPPVFFGAAGIVLAFILFGGIFTNTAERVFNRVLDFITAHFGWYYVVITAAFLVFVVWLYFSKYSRIRLGGPDARPEFSNFAWFTMLFAAGMGMGLVFWGVAEPLTHYAEPPDADPQTPQALRDAMRYSFFHWGLHPWAVYIIFGLGIAYFHYRHGLPLAPRSMLFPLLGRRIFGPIGHLTDIICTVGTLLGVATSLGLGAMQINSGFHALLDVEVSPANQLLIIGTITLVATTSTITGVGRGIKYLSMLNIYIMFGLLLFVAIVGPTGYQVKIFLTTLGEYLQNLPRMSLHMDISPDASWQGEWTFFYWGWWISWCPFVGIFVARISRGRTIREFIQYVFVLPPLVTFLWISVFGGTGLFLEQYQDIDLTTVVTDNVAISLHALLEHLPMTNLMQWISLVLIIIFFITSSDSGSLVDDMVTSGGHPNPPAVQRAFWGLSEGAAAAVLVVAGGLSALQSASISGGLIQSILVIFSAVSLTKALKVDSQHEGVPDLTDLHDGTPESPAAEEWLD